MKSIDASHRTRLVRDLLRWGRKNFRSFPWRDESDPFKVLVAEVLLQRSRGKTVAKVYEELFRRWPNAQALSRARIESIRSVIRPLGLINRAQNLKALAQEVSGIGEVPRTIVSLDALPGVGPYAASATAAVAFNQHVPTVDGVTARVYRRYFLLPTDLPASEDPDLWEVVRQVTPRKAVREWNWSVLDLASAICLPKIPRCGDCPLKANCLTGRRILRTDLS